MEVFGTQQVKIEISDYEAKKIALNYIRKRFDFKEDYWIKDGKLLERHEYGGSHSWSEDEFVREATADDILIYSMINKINSQLGLV